MIVQNKIIDGEFRNRQTFHQLSNIIPALQWL